MSYIEMDLPDFKIETRIEKKPKERRIMAKTTPPKTKRKSIRFHSTPLATALVDLKMQRSFRPTLSGLVLSESFSGCALLLILEDAVKEGQIVQIKIGEMDPMNAKIVWIKEFPENIKKIGFHFES